MSPVHSQDGRRPNFVQPPPGRIERNGTVYREYRVIKLFSANHMAETRCIHDIFCEGMIRCTLCQYHFPALSVIMIRYILQTLSEEDLGNKSVFTSTSEQMDYTSWMETSRISGLLSFGRCVRRLGNLRVPLAARSRGLTQAEAEHGPQCPSHRPAVGIGSSTVRLSSLVLACAWQVRVLAVNILKKWKLIYQIICVLLVVNLRFTPRRTKAHLRIYIERPRIKNLDKKSLSEKQILLKAMRC